MRSRVSMIARTPRLLFAVDFDGTLAPIVSHYSNVLAHPRALDLLQEAAALEQTNVAVVSGRGLDDLRGRIPVLQGVWLVGGHGAEVSGPKHESAPGDLSHVLDDLMEKLQKAAPREQGFLHERKRGSIAVHYRGVDEVAAAPVVSFISESIAKPAGLYVQHGKKVIEIMVVDADKGRTISKLKDLSGATAIFYIGDDATDEHAFKMLGPVDLAVKIGEPPTEADMCVGTIEEAHEMMAELVAERQLWLKEIMQPPIQHHSILSDQRTLAVVAPDASIGWLCLPRIDSASVFSSLLDRDGAGKWSIRPANASPAIGQCYVGNTFSLETSWASMKVTDYLDGSGGRTFQRAGRTDLIRVLEGRGMAHVVFCPRLDFSRAKTKIVPVEDGLVIEGGADPMVVASPGVAWTIEETDGVQRATAEIPLSGTPVVLELRSGTRSVAPSRIPEPQRRSQTERIWSAWADSLHYPSVATDQCRRSALVLRALAYGPTGAVLAAGTTSLPETAGGSRNWDYRFCWPRDASIASAALVRLGNTGVAMKYLDWLLGVVDRCAGPERLRPIYTVTGDELGTEAELSNLNGYRASQPVRIGNAAAHQVQLDVFGPIVDLVFYLAEAGAAISPDHWRLVEAMTVAVERRWQEPDHGIWEVRTNKRHHVHSKAMCWMALDRAVKLADQFVGIRRESWEKLRDQIRDDVLVNGFDEKLGGFIAAYDLREPDAAALTLGLIGLIDPKDPRFVGTVDLVLSRLLRGHTVMRYEYPDELPGVEGGFHLCTGWLIESLTLIGRREKAEELFKHLCGAMGPTGIMSEQWCPTENIGLGNLAQAYSHAALISSAIALSGK